MAAALYNTLRFLNRQHPLQVSGDYCFHLFATTSGGGWCGWRMSLTWVAHDAIANYPTEVWTSNGRGWSKETDTGCRLLAAAGSVRSQWLPSTTTEATGVRRDFGLSRRPEPTNQLGPGPIPQLPNREWLPQATTGTGTWIPQLKQPKSARTLNTVRGRAD